MNFCLHEWEEYDDTLEIDALNDQRTQVRCDICLELGERNNLTQEVYYPVS